MLDKIKQFIFKNKFLYILIQKCRSRIQYRGNLTIINDGLIRINKEISGGHVLIVGKHTTLDNVTIHMTGNDNRIIFEDNIYVGPGSSFWAEGAHVKIIIGNGTTFTRNDHVNAQENYCCIKIGTDCMFSNNIIVRTSDSHPIFDTESAERVNPPKNVVIGNHVWIAPNSRIMKGSIIEDGCIIGSDTMVTRKIPANTLAVGHPAKVVKTNVTWKREQAW